MDIKIVNKNIKKLEKKENELLKQRQKCRETKCSKEFKLKEKKNKIFEKEQDKQCPKKLSNDEFYKCSDKFYNASEYKTIYDDYAQCGENKCKSYKKKLHTLRDKLLAYDMAKITKMKDKEKSKKSKKSKTNMSGGMKKNLTLKMTKNNPEYKNPDYQQQIKNIKSISKCSKKKCGYLQKKMHKEQKIFDKTTENCPSTNDNSDGYYKCYDELYNKSNLNIIQGKLIECKFTKCKKEYANARAFDIKIDKKNKKM